MPSKRDETEKQDGQQTVKVYRQNHRYDLSKWTISPIRLTEKKTRLWKSLSFISIWPSTDEDGQTDRPIDEQP